VPYPYGSDPIEVTDVIGSGIHIFYIGYMYSNSNIVFVFEFERSNPTSLVLVKIIKKKTSLGKNIDFLRFFLSLVYQSNSSINL
jgi:hypothetical protein